MSEENLNRLPQYPLDQSQIDESPRTPADQTITDYLLKIDAEIEASDRDKRLKLYRQQLKAHKYFDGSFHGYVDEELNWKEDVREAGEVWYDDNQLYQYFRTALMELARTQTKVQFAAVSDDENFQAAAKLAQTLYEAERSRTFSAHLKQTENTYALLNGVTFRYTFADFSKRGEKIPQFTKTAAEKQTEKMCAACIRPLKKNEDECAVCGSAVVSLMEISADGDYVMSYRDLPEAANLWMIPNPVSIIVSLQAASICETPYLKWKQLVLRSVLEDKYQGLRLPSTGTKSLELQYITNQKANAPAVNTYTDGEGSGANLNSSAELELLEYHQVWLDYALYANKIFDKDCRLAGGKTLPAKTSLGKLFPHGLYFAVIGGLVVDMWDENKNRKWTSSPYSLRPGSMYGHGSAHALADQEILNEQMKLKMSNLWNNAVPREFVDVSIIPELSVDPARPTEVNNPDGRQIVGTAYQVVPGVTLSQEVYAMSENVQRSMQGKIGAFSLQGSGAADLRAMGNTATAIATARDLAVGRFAPDLELMADNLDRLQAIQFLRNIQEFYNPAQWKRAQGKYGAGAVKAFLEMDIERDLLVTIAPGSYMPKSDAQVIAKLSQALEFLPALMQTEDPELIAYAYETFGLPKHLGGWDAPRSHAQKVIDRLTDGCEQFLQTYGDAPTVDLSHPQVMQAAGFINEQIKMPIDAFLDDHDALINAYRDWRMTDEGANAPNLLIACIALRVRNQMKAKTNAKQFLAGEAIREQQPVQEFEQAKQAEQQALQAEQQAAAAQMQESGMMMQAAEKFIDLEEREAERRHEADESTKQQETDAAIAALGAMR